MIINTLHKEDAPQKVCAEKAGCSESAILKHINGKLTKKVVEKNDSSLEFIIKKSYTNCTNLWYIGINIQ